MKKLSTISFTVISLAAFIVVGVSFAGERVMVIEMADGNLVTFIMTPEEIAVQDAARAELERRRAVRSVNPKKKTATFEMGESGLFVSFPIAEKEAATEDAKNARLEARRTAIVRKPKPNIVKVELAESGNYILFPADRDDKDQEIKTVYSQKSQ